MLKTTVNGAVVSPPGTNPRILVRPGTVGKQLKLTRNNGTELSINNGAYELTARVGENISIHYNNLVKNNSLTGTKISWLNYEMS